MNRNKLYKLILFIGIGLIVLLQFQNCSDVKFSDAEVVDVDIPDDPTVKTQTFNFGPVSNKIDILVVVDNSGSMAVEQKSLGERFDTFISGLQGIDWQIGITTTDVGAEKGRLIGPAQENVTYGPQHLITPNTPNAASVFSRTVQRTYTNDSRNIYLSGSSDEQALLAAQLTIAGNNDPDVAKGLFRENSNLAIVILSDEDERSCGGDSNRSDCGSQYKPLRPENTPTNLIANFNRTFENKKSLLVNAIIIKPDDSSCYSLQSGSGGKYGYTYADLAELTDGVLGSICDSGSGAYSDELKNISENIYDRVNSKTIILDKVPTRTPEITITPTDATLMYQWIVGTNKIVFNKYPENKSIQVKYYYQ